VTKAAAFLEQRTPLPEALPDGEDDDLSQSSFYIDFSNVGAVDYIAVVG